MKTKTCKRQDCKFYHITGTKKEEAVDQRWDGTSASNSNCFSNNNSVNNGNKHSNNVERRNGKNLQPTTQPMNFHEAKQPWEIAIERMSAQMERMMDLQQSFQSQIQPLLQLQRNLNAQTQGNWN